MQEQNEYGVVQVQDQSIYHTRIAFKKASNSSLAYDLLSLINLQVKCSLPILRYNTNILMNTLGLKKKKNKQNKKKNESVLCIFSVAMA